MDIVERLRQGIERYEEPDAELAMDNAADEIERLRAALKPFADLAGLGGCIVEGPLLEQARAALSARE